MAFEADRVVVELIAKVDQFDRPMKQSATTFDSSMNKITASAAKAEAAAGGFGKSTGKVAQDISRHSQAMKRDFVNLGAVLTGPTSPFVVPVKQAPQVASAMRVISVGAGALGRIMGGLLVTSALAAAAALASYILKGDEAEDTIRKLVEKLKEQAEKTRQAATAQQIFDRSIEGSILKIDELTKALIEQNRTLEETINLNKAAAASALGNVAVNIGAVSADLARAVSALQNAKSELALAERGVLGGTPSEIAASVDTAQARVVAAEANVRALTGTLEALSGAANRGAAALKAVDFPLLERDAEEAVDPIAAINRKFDDMAKKAKTAGTYTAELAKQIEKLRAAELKAARDKPSSSGLFGRQVGFSEAAAIASAAGLQVNSGYRSTAQQAALFNNPAVNRPGNPVAPPGSSAHEGVRGKWALDIAFAPGLTPQKIRKVYGDQGISLSAVLKEKGHFHIEGSRSEAARAETEAQREAEQALRRQNAAEELRDRLNEELLRAEAALVQGVEEQARIASDQVVADQQRFDRALQNDVEEGKLPQALADEFKLINERIAVARLRLIEREKQLRLDQARFALEDQGRQFAIDDLQFAEEMARSQAEHREIQLQILDAVIEQKRLELEHAKDLAIRNGATKDEIAAIQAKIDRLPSERAAGAARVERGTMGPLESFLDSLPQSAAAANEALEQMAVGGIQSVVDGLAQAGTEWIKLGGTAGKIINQLISDLIRLVLYQQLLGPLAKLIGGGSSVAGITPFSTPGALDDYVPGAASGIVGTIGGRGGVDNNILSINGKRALRVSKGETLAVIPSNATAAPAGGGGGNTYISVPIYANDAVLAETVKGWVREGVSIAIQGGARGGAALARDGLARKTLHRLG